MREPMEFVISRFSRLFPVYWAAVALTWTLVATSGLQGHSVSWKTALFNLTMAVSELGVVLAQRGDLAEAVPLLEQNAELFRAGRLPWTSQEVQAIGILGSALKGKALRSMKAPGTANDLDHQAGSMSGYADLPDDDDPAHDNGGVHLNSGIPNRAFYLAASAIGGHAWEAAGRIWYVTLTGQLEPASGFRAAADATIAVAGDLFGAASQERQAVSGAWKEVGVL